jgi:hypothetical protein
LGRLERSAAYPGKLRGDFASLKRAGIPGAGDYHGPGSTVTMPGTRVVRWRCLECRRVHEASYCPLDRIMLPCAHCKQRLKVAETGHERIYD